MYAIGRSEYSEISSLPLPHGNLDRWTLWQIQSILLLVTGNATGKRQKFEQKVWLRTNTPRPADESILKVLVSHSFIYKPIVWDLI